MQKINMRKNAPEYMLAEEYERNSFKSKKPKVKTPTFHAQTLLWVKVTTKIS